MNNININQTNNETKKGLIIALLSLVVAGFALGGVPYIYIPLGIATIIISIILIVKRKNEVKKAAIIALVTTLIGMGFNTAYWYSYGKMVSLEKEIVSKSKGTCKIVTEGSDKLVYCEGQTPSEKTEIQKIVDEWENTGNNAIVITLVAFIYSIIWLILNTVFLGRILAKIKKQNDLEQFANYGSVGNFQYGQVQNMNPQPQYGQVQNMNPQTQYGQVQNMNPQTQYGQVQNRKPQPQFNLTQNADQQQLFSKDVSSIKNSNDEKIEFPPKLDNK